MKLLHIIAQILAMAGQIYVPSLPLKDSTKHVVMSTVGFLQGCLGIIALSIDPKSGMTFPGTKIPVAGAVIIALVTLLWCGANLELAAADLAGGSRASAVLPVSDRLIPASDDVWRDLAHVLNPFAADFNKGHLDLGEWHKVLKQIYSMEGCDCDPRKGRI